MSLDEAREAAKAQSPEALEAFEGALGATKREAAIKLAPFRKMLGSLLETKELEPKDIANIADEYVEKGSFTFDGKTFDKAQLSALIKGKTAPLQDLDKILPGLAELFGIKMKNGASPESLLPGQEELTLPARRIAEATAENTGGFMGMLNKAWFAIEGFFGWMMGGFKDNLFDHIKAAGADAIVSSTRDKLQQDINEKPQLAVALGGPQGVEDVLAKLHDGIMNSGKEGAEKPFSKDAITRDVAAQPAIELMSAEDLQKPEKKEALQKTVESVKQLVSGVVQGQITSILTPGANQDFWENKKNAIVAELEKKGKDGTRTWYELTEQERLALPGSADVVRSYAADALNDKNKKLIGEAIADATVAAFKDMGSDKLKGFLASPKEHADEVAALVVEKLKATDKWKQVAENMKDKSLTAEALLPVFQGKISEMVKSSDGLLKKLPDTAPKMILAVQGALKEQHVASAPGAPGKAPEVKKEDRTQKDENPHPLSGLTANVPLRGVAPDVQNFGQHPDSFHPQPGAVASEPAVQLG